MYLPQHFQASDQELQDLLSRGAGDLVTATQDGLLASFLPFLHEPGVGEHGALLGHLARANPQWQQSVQGEALVILRGPDAYISPNLYPSRLEDPKVVPTWNYLTAHVYGTLVVHDDPEWVEALVRRLTDYHEVGETPPWSVDDVPAGYLKGRLRAIVGLELQITRIEAKAKLSQNRPEIDKPAIVAGLAARGEAGTADAVRDSASHTLG
jgi:transcriptional regulator